MRLIEKSILLMLYFGSVNADTGYFWHVTDMHWDPSYSESVAADSCGSSSEGGDKTYGPYGDYLCDSPWKLINSSIEAMASIKPDVDFLIWTGDDTPHNVEPSKDAVANIILNLTQKILEVFPNTTVFPVLGNHDWSPKHQLPPRKDDFYDRIADMWTPWLMHDTAANDAFRNNGYYSMQLNDYIRLVGLNTNLYYTNNLLTVDMPDPGNQLQWLDDTLTDAANQKLKVILIGHVPPGQFEKHADKYWFQPFYNQVFVHLLRKHSRVFGSIHFAHHHSDSFRIIYDDAGLAVSSILIAPAVTPWETTLPDVMGGGENNPGIRLLKYNRTDGTILDIDQYYLNLTKANIDNKANWTRAYQGSVYYDQPDMTTSSLQSIAQSLMKDDRIFDKYYKANCVFFDLDEVWSVDYQIVHFCAITELDYKNYSMCIEKITHQHQTPVPLRLA